MEPGLVKRRLSAYRVPSSITLSNSMSENQITEWIRRYQDGDSSAANHLWQSYYEKLIALARKKLGGSRKRVADEEDMVAEAFHSFFRGVEIGRFPRLEDRDDLWQILVMLTARKSANQVKLENRQKRGGGNVRGESVFQRNDDSTRPGISDIVGSDPSPEFVDDVIAHCEELLATLGEGGSLREIAIRKLEGFTNQEIADDLEVNLRTVDRKLRMIRDILQTHQE